jgi:pescadillo protein
MGKKLKKGVKGEAAQFITRSKAIRKLQLTLKDFRRLCILKGVYPREPKRKLKGRTKTYYHVKDINFLSHEKILEKFREMKLAMKKYKKYMRKDDPEKAKKIKENMPSYTLNHLVKERYPTFPDALRDLDDPLCLINLFSSFQAHKLFDIPNDRVQSCIRLAKEFNFYVIKSRTLKKVFLSIKGIYYQAEIQGQPVTWIVPYQFTQKLPADVDYRVMLTFLEFYETMLKFTNFKLYSSLNLKYPPKINLDLEANLDSFSYSTMVVENKENNIETEIQDKKYQISNEFNADETILQMKNKYENEAANLFEGLVFFCNREVPKYSLEFVILAFGGQILWDTETVNIEDKRITHVITDRDPKFIQVLPNREYIQPQWVYDCINNKILLPIGDYAPGKVLPPHLSPFADSKEDGGYKPERQIEIEKLKGEHTGMEEEAHIEKGANDLEEEKSEDEEDDDYDYAKELNRLKAMKKDEEEELKKLSETMMSKKKRRMYLMMMNGKSKLKERALFLTKKREKLKRMNKLMGQKAQEV